MADDVIKISGLTESTDFANLFTIGTHTDEHGNVTSVKVSLANLLKVVSDVTITESSEDGGTNVVVFTLLNGTTYTLNVLNGTKGSQGIQGPTGATGDTGPKGDTGNGISSIEAVSVSTESGGHSVYRITMTSGATFDFTVYNGNELAENLASWEARDDSPIDSVSADLIRTTGGDESINSAGGAKLISMACIGKDFIPTRIISSGFNLLRLQSNNGLAVAVGAGWYFPVPKLTATSDSIGTSTENNGVLFTDSEGHNLTPTVYFKPLASGVPTSVNDGTVATYVDKNGRRHYTTSGPGYLIVSGITWASTCAHLGWSTNYDKYVSPTDADDAGTIVSTTGIGTLRSVGSGNAIVSDRADRISDTQMRKTVNVGASSSLTWENTEDVDSEGRPTGTYTHSAVIAAMLSGGVADIKLNGGSQFAALAVDGQTVSFVDTNATVASGYEVKYQLATPTTSNVNVSSVFAHINNWGIEYVDATGEGNGLWQYLQGIPDAIYGLLGKRQADNGVIAQAFAWVKSEIDGLKARLNNYSLDAKLAVVDALAYMTGGKPMFLLASTAGAPSASIVPDNWDEEKYGVWRGVPYAANMFYTDTASKKVYFAPKVTNSTADWIALN